MGFEGDRIPFSEEEGCRIVSFWVRMGEMVL